MQCFMAGRKKNFYQCFDYKLININNNMFYVHYNEVDLATSRKSYFEQRNLIF